MDYLRNKLKGDTGRLAATYLTIIMGLTIIFSGIIYSISSSQYDRPLQPGGHDETYQFDNYTRTSLQHIFDQRGDQARAELLLSLALLNLAVLIGGGFLSYVLARKSLEPIEAAMRSQAQFVSDASHELRTPLTALQITNEVALRKKKLNLADAKDLIGHNLAETIKLHNLSEALLGLAKQDSADTSKKQMSLPEVVLGAVQTLQPLADEKQIKITHDIPATTVVVNEAAVGQILRILLDNAIKYSANKSTVTVAATLDKSTTISIKDDGPGIAPEHQTKIFDRFYRIDESRTSQTVAGNGLGLAIARSIADRHGYRISVYSQADKGATFSLHI